MTENPYESPLAQLMMDSGYLNTSLDIDVYDFFDRHDLLVSMDKFNAYLNNINSDEKLTYFMDNYDTPYDKPSDLDILNIVSESRLEGNYSEIMETLNREVENVKVIVNNYEKYLYEIYSHMDTDLDSSNYLKNILDISAHILDILESNFTEEDITDWLDEEESITQYEAQPTTAQVLEYIKGECKSAIEDVSDLAVKEHFIYTWDSSVNAPGIELVTPVLKYEDFITAIPNLVDSLADAGFGGDVSCGYHIGISSDKINVKQLIRDSYQRYQDKGYSKFASAMATLQQGYLNIFKYHNPERVAYAEEYAKSLITFLLSKGISLDTFDERELMYGSNSNLDYYVGEFFKEKYVDTNTKHRGYVELRTLGGEEGFEILRDTSKLKLFLYDAISQVFGGFKELSAKEIAKLVNIHRREDLKAEPFTSNRMAKIKRKTAELRNKQEER